jgi:hypothetical protein
MSAKDYIFNDDNTKIFESILSSLNDNTVSYKLPIDNYPVKFKRNYTYINMPFSDIIIHKNELIKYYDEDDDGISAVQDRLTDKMDYYHVNQDKIKTSLENIYNYWSEPIGLTSVKVVNKTKANPDERSGKYRTNTFEHILINPTFEDIIKAVVYTKNAKEDWWYEGCPSYEFKIRKNTGHIHISWDHGS